MNGLPEGLERLLRAAYKAGRENSTGAQSSLGNAMSRIANMDATQSGAYGRASQDALDCIRRALDKCPECGHKPHGSWCANMASDNECSCTHDPAGKWIGELEIGDKLTAIAELDDAIGEPELPSLQVQTPVHFKEGTFVVWSYQSNGNDGMSVSLVECRCEWEASPPNIACPIHREGK